MKFLCGKDGHALNSVNCPVHGWEQEAAKTAIELYKHTNNGYAHFSEAVYQLFKRKNP